MPSKRRNYEQRLVIPINGGNDRFYTYSDLLIANGFCRVVIGGRGPYIEFNDAQIVSENIIVPPNQQHRLNNDSFYYDEYRSKCKSNVKVYHQKNTVTYADYQVGFWYIDPMLLKTENFQNLLLPLYEESSTIEENDEPQIWRIGNHGKSN